MVYISSLDCTSSRVDSLKNVDVLLRANFLELIGPDGHGDFAEMGGAQQVHISPGLADTTTNTQRNFVI